MLESLWFVGSADIKDYWRFFGTFLSAWFNNHHFAVSHQVTKGAEQNTVCHHGDYEKGEWNESIYLQEIYHLRSI